MILTNGVAGLAAMALATVLGVAAAQEKAPAALGGEGLENGIYLLRFEGDGRKVKFTDGSERLLGKYLSPAIGTGVRLRSWTNDNTRFSLHIKGLGPLPKEVTEMQTALVVDGVVLHLGRPDKLADDGTADCGANVDSEAAAKILAARYRIEPELRKHPGHRFAVRWTPGKQSYEVGEAVILTMELTNTGTGPLEFTHGGKQRGPRDNQFRFVAQAGADGKGLADTGNAQNFGGISSSITLKPGEVYTARVELTNWFKFTESNTYRITGIMELPIVNANSPDGWRPVWDDLAVGECDVRVVARKK